MRDRALLFACKTHARVNIYSFSIRQAIRLHILMDARGSEAHLPCSGIRPVFYSTRVQLVREGRTGERPFILIKSLDMSCSKSLENLYCYGNMMKTLDIGKIPYVKNIKCMNNPMTVIDIRKHPNLKTVNLAPMPTLVTLYCKSIYDYTSLIYPFTTDVKFGK